MDSIMLKVVKLSDGSQAICIKVPRGEAVRSRTDPPSAQKDDNLKRKKEETLNWPSNEVDDSSYDATLDASVSDDQPESRPSSSKRTGKTAALAWTAGWTKQLLYLYTKYIKHVGPTKKFKTNKNMWQQIARNINAVHNTALNFQQCETRFKTLKRRKLREKSLAQKSDEEPEREPQKSETSAEELEDVIKRIKDAAKENDPPLAQKDKLQGMLDEPLNEPSNEVDDASFDDNSRHSTVDASVNDDRAESRPSSSKTTDKAAAILWTDGWTKLLLDLYAQYIRHVGPQKKFKNNKDMWHQVARDINAVHDTAITWQQCETRFKTVKRRKIKEKGFKHTSGEGALAMAYQNEWEQLESQDDFIIPEVLLGNEDCVVNKVLPSRSSALRSRSSHNPLRKPKRRKSSAEVVEDGIKRLMAAKENREKLRNEAKEKRHQEKLALLRVLLSKD